MKKETSDQIDLHIADLLESKSLTPEKAKEIAATLIKSIEEKESLSDVDKWVLNDLKKTLEKNK